MNMYWEDLTFELPEAPNGAVWHVFTNTGDAENEIQTLGDEPQLDDQKWLPLKARSVVVLVGKAGAK